MFYATHATGRRFEKSKKREPAVGIRADEIKCFLFRRVAGAQTSEIRQAILFRFPGLAAGLLMLLDLFVLQLSIVIGLVHERVHSPRKAAVIAIKGAGCKCASGMAADRM